MKTIRQLVELIPSHILDMDLTQTFLVGFDKTDVQVQVDRLIEIGTLPAGKQLSDKAARKVVDALAEGFDPEVGIYNGLIRDTIVDLLAKKEIALE